MKNIAVIGSGTMGNGIAHTFAQFGYNVALVDISEKALEKGITTISKNLDRQVIKGTTNPGVTILKSFGKFNPSGAAVVKSDEWYYDLWKFGKHHGKIDALLQLGTKVKVYRDGDKDNKSEEQGLLQEGFFGINYHSNGYDIDAKATGTVVGGWSAGCQVPCEIQKYKKQMQEFKASKQSTFTYCLLKEF